MITRKPRFNPEVEMVESRVLLSGATANLRALAIHEHAVEVAEARAAKLEAAHARLEARLEAAHSRKVSAAPASSSSASTVTASTPASPPVIVPISPSSPTTPPMMTQASAVATILASQAAGLSTSTASPQPSVTVSTPSVSAGSSPVVVVQTNAPSPASPSATQATMPATQATSDTTSAPQAVADASPSSPAGGSGSSSASSGDGSSSSSSSQAIALNGTITGTYSTQFIPTHDNGGEQHVYSGSGSIQTLGSVTIGGSLIALTSPVTGEIGTITLTGSQGNVTLKISGNSSSTGQYSFQMVSGTGIYANATDSGTISVTESSAQTVQQDPPASGGNTFSITLQSS